MSAFHDNALMGASGSQGYQISRSVRLRSSASAYFNRTLTTPTNATTFTLSRWLKRGKLGAFQALFDCTATNQTNLCFNSSDQLSLYVNSGTPSLTSTAVFRDPSAWYHIVWSSSGTTQTIYVNNQVVATGTVTLSRFNTAVAHYIGAMQAGSYFEDGYLTEVNFIDGQALTPSSFGETDTITGVWKPKKYAGTYGTNGFYLNFSDNSNNTAATIGKDYSGNGNNWTPNNISVTSGVTYDSMLDVPTPYADGGNGRGNYAVMNPLTTTAGTYSSANLRYVGASAWRRSNATISVSTGKWYWEVTLGNAPYSPRGSTTSYNALGFGLSTVFNSTTQSSGVTDAVILADNGYYKNFSGSWTDGGTGFSSGDTLAVAVDLDANTFTFYRNNTQVTTGTIGGTAGRELVPIILSYDGSYGVMDCNFGQRPFAYTPPSGFKALNTQNLPSPTISNGATVMAATTFDGVTGGGTVTNTVNGVGFKPDMVWMKVRNNANNHELADSVRGTAYAVFPNLTNAEVSDTRVSAFNSNGFSYGTNSNSAVTGRTVVGWQWQAGQGSTSSNTSGSITSTVSVNATAGFSVVSFNSGTAGNKTVGHGLGVTPSFIITKNRDSVASWAVWSSSFSNTAQGYLLLNGTGAVTNDSRQWANTAPTSTVFSFESGYTFTASQNIIAYCWSAVAGYSAFGSYTGNGSTDGPFVYTGFRPRFIMTKRTDAVSQWNMWDTSRNPYNTLGNILVASSSAAEDTTYLLDILSNGFKPRVGAGYAMNDSGGTYIYMAFAENPFRNALAR